MTASAPPLQDRVVALFGGGGRLAPFLTRRLLDAGAAVALVDASAEGLARVAGQLAGAARVAAFTADVTDEAAVSVALQALLARFGRLDRSSGPSTRRSPARSTPCRSRAGAGRWRST